jgi:hypothetical protein
MTDTKLEVLVSIVDQRTQKCASTRGFPSDASGSRFAAAIPLETGQMHWVHLTLQGERLHIVAGNKMAASRFELTPAHDGWTRLERSSACVSYDIEKRFTATISVAPKEAKAPSTPEVARAIPKRPASAEEVVRMLSARTRR